MQQPQLCQPVEHAEMLPPVGPRAGHLLAVAAVSDISKILAEAETMLFGLIVTLIKRPEIAESVLATKAGGESSVMGPVRH
jgi:hypothetical protein